MLTKITQKAPHNETPIIWLGQGAITHSLERECIPSPYSDLMQR